MVGTLFIKEKIRMSEIEFPVLNVKMVDIKLIMITLHFIVKIILIIKFMFIMI